MFLFSVCHDDLSLLRDDDILIQIRQKDCREVLYEHLVLYAMDGHANIENDEYKVLV